MGNYYIKYLHLKMQSGIVVFPVGVLCNPHCQSSKQRYSSMYTLGIHSSTAKSFDPNRNICGQSIPFIADKSIKFLGGLISVPTNVQKYQNHLQLKLETLLEKLDMTAISRKQKLLLY